MLCNINERRPLSMEKRPAIIFDKSVKKSTSSKNQRSAKKNYNNWAILKNLNQRTSKFQNKWSDFVKRCKYTVQLWFSGLSSVNLAVLVKNGFIFSSNLSKYTEFVFKLDGKQSEAKLGPGWSMPSQKSMSGIFSRLFIHKTFIVDIKLPPKSVQDSRKS